MVTRAADYALRATLVLAGYPPGSRMCLNELAEACQVPPAYLYKVLGSLARHGLLVPHRGVTGGYELTSLARASTVLDVVEAVNGLPLLNACVMSGGCHRTAACPAHPVWIQAQERVREVLATARIAELAPLRPDAAPPAGRLPRRSPGDEASRGRPSVERKIRRPAHEGRRPQGTYLKRMEDR
jgi:Rrf2 family transcriptional regulator, nitric oxide-sensitive transcriptional repressor